MTDPTQAEVPAGDRKRLSDYEQMLDAQAGCVPCKLCGGGAIIFDAGPGHGYYIRCGNSVTFRESRGCLINERRLGGWAYNVMDWWNRLHAALSPPAPASGGDKANLEAQRQTIEACARVLERLASSSLDDGRKWFNHPASNEAFERAIAGVRALRPNESLAFAARPAGEVERLREAEGVARPWAEHYAGGDGEQRRMERLCDDIADEIAALVTEGTPA